MKSYVCVLATDDFLDGVLVLNQNLKALNSKYPLLCLINENISDETKKTLDFFDIEYRVFPSIEYHKNKSYTRWNNTFNKFNVFRLTDYDRIVYLDSDFIILENLDHLFYIDKFTMNSDLPYNTDRCNSSIIITKPNMDDYNSLIDLLNKYDEIGIDSIGDQNVMNDCFNNIYSLDSSYNVMRVISGDTNEQNKHLIEEITKDVINPKVIHYIGYSKPFMVDGLLDDDYSDLYIDYLNAIREIKKMIN